MLPSVANESKDIGESALENPLPWDTIPSTKYDRFNLVEPYLPELRKRSAERIAADKEFAYVREDIELFKKQQADKTLSLNEQQRLKEQDEAEARQKARDKERLARPEPTEKVYELTLKLAALQGLPPPVTKTNAALAKLPVKPGAGTNVAPAQRPRPPSARIIPTSRKQRNRPHRTCPWRKRSISCWITFRWCRKGIWSRWATDGLVQRPKSKV